MRRQHFAANENQHQRQPVMQILKHLHHPRQGEVHGSQSQNGKNVGGVDHHDIQRDREHRGNRIDGQEQIGSLDDKKHNQQGRGVDARTPDKKPVAHEIVRHRHPSAKKPQSEIFLRMDRGILLAHQSDPAVNQKHAERIRDPMELLDQLHARHNKCRAHDHCAQNSPEQNFVLILRRHPEITEHQEKDKKVIDAERKLYDISRHKLERRGMAAPEVEQHSKPAGQPNPNQAPCHRFPKPDGVGAPMKNPEIEGEHQRHQQVENNPED